MWPKHYILDDDGEPVAVTDIMVWGKWFERASRDRSRVLKQDFVEEDAPADVSIPGVVGVSTVFLGLDHNWSLTGPPVLWESLVSGTSLDGEMQRYTSRGAALAGHEVLLARVRAAYEKERR